MTLAGASPAVARWLMRTLSLPPPAPWQRYPLGFRPAWPPAHRVVGIAFRRMSTKRPVPERYGRRSRDQAHLLSSSRHQAPSHPGGSRGRTSSCPLRLHVLNRAVCHPQLLRIVSESSCSLRGQTRGRSSRSMTATCPLVMPATTVLSADPKPMRTPSPKDDYVREEHCPVPPRS